ncbi:hypothetical protein PRK78_002802 [Emydomyces testavorans]|uniref:LIM zinc-binding domain-containing protein n=1 Tax=Emydomyces testavorans TaxID=2070801 RepID=A0AAF0DH18_9EURO|nr:hypothetical protein PRK78_002802 [Emydomyces testavorans]
MAADLGMRLDDFLPKIKCSNCQAEVELSAMGDHVCSKDVKGMNKTSLGGQEPRNPANLLTAFEAGPAPTPQSPQQTRTSPLSSPPRTHMNRLDGPLAKIGRMAPPPPIDPSAANRPFLRLHVPISSGSSSGIRSASPVSAASPKSPIRQPQRSHTSPPRPPSPALSNLDCAFPPFPRPDSRSSAKSRSRSKTLVKVNHAQSPLPASSAKDDEEELRERRRRSQANKHKREMSIDSKSLSRLSVTSSRYGDSSATSTPGLLSSGSSRGFVLDEVPPLPTGLMKSYTPSPFSAAPEPYRFSSKEAFEEDKDTTSSARPGNAALPTGLPGFELGFPIGGEVTKPQDQHSQTARLSNGSSDSVPQVDGHSDSQKGPDQKLGVPASVFDGDFSISNFARKLGLGGPYHATNKSTSSSDSSPSDAATSSSFSTQPSEPPSATEFKPPPNPYKYDPDSPTDPLFQQGSFKRTPPKYNRFAELEQASVSQEAPSLLSRAPSQVEPHPNRDESRSSTPAPSKSPAPSRRVRCRGCEQIIVGKSVSSADGRLTGRWHKACFVCHTCRSPFQTSDFYVLGNHPYCAQHYHELNGSLCCSCKLGIEGPCLQTEETVRDEKSGKETRQIFHPDCFQCKTCRIVLKGDYLEWNGDVYCDRDGRRAAAMAYPPPSPSPGPGPGNNGPPPGYGRRPPYNSSPLAGGPPPRGAPGPGPAPSRGRGLPRPSNRGPGGPMPGPRLYPPNKNGSGPAQRPPMGGAQKGPPGPRRFPERRTTKLMML